jgi:hypothetical protein
MKFETCPHAHRAPDGAAHQRRRAVALAELRSVQWQARETSFPMSGTSNPASLMHSVDLVVMAERLHPIPFRTRP